MHGARQCGTRAESRVRLRPAGGGTGIPAHYASQIAMPALPYRSAGPAPRPRPALRRGPTRRVPFRRSWTSSRRGTDAAPRRRRRFGPPPGRRFRNRPPRHPPPRPRGAAVPLALRPAGHAAVAGAGAGGEDRDLSQCGSSKTDSADRRRSLMNPGAGQVLAGDEPGPAAALPLGMLYGLMNDLGRVCSGSPLRSRWSGAGRLAGGARHPAWCAAPPPSAEIRPDRSDRLHFTAAVTLRKPTRHYQDSRKHINSPGKNATGPEAAGVGGVWTGDPFDV